MSDQKYTPKYWVAHKTDSDDILIETASKSYFDAEKEIIVRVGPNYIELGYEIRCAEVCFVSDQI